MDGSLDDTLPLDVDALRTPAPTGAVDVGEGCALTALVAVLLVYVVLAGLVWWIAGLVM